MTPSSFGGGVMDYLPNAEQAMTNANMSGKTIMFTSFGKTSLRYSFILSMPSSAMAALVASADALQPTNAIILSMCMIQLPCLPALWPGI